MKNKSGIQLAISTIILIVLGVMVLIGLILLLATQTSFFSDVLDNFRSESNVDDVITSCNLLATGESLFSYCCEEKVVKLGKGKQDIRATCGELVDEDFIGGRIEELDCDGVVCSS